MGNNLLCNVCARRNDGTACETARVRSNVRSFRAEQFAVWRCPGCSSIHARDEVDLDRYYRGYPFFGGTLDRFSRAVYENRLRRMVRVGVRRDHRILDYGCGSGTFVAFLREAGYRTAFGYDAYSPAHADPSVLDSTYDCVTCQDVIEHVPEPRALLDTFARLVRPGGVVLIGTPDASAVDLADPEEHAHSLHQPYHRHILSMRALTDIGRGLGWSIDRMYDTAVFNTLVPFVNQRFFRHFGRSFDDTLDLFFDTPSDLRPLRSLATLFYGYFGYFLAPKTEMMAIFRVPRGPAIAASPIPAT